MKEALEKAAAKDGRSVSSLVERIVIEWMGRQNGVLQTETSWGGTRSTGTRA